MKIVNGRKSEYDIENIFLERQSRRAMSGATVSHDEMMTLFEAAKWAPSSRNEQPWRFVYAQKDTNDFELFFSFLTENNKAWCKNASILVVVLSQKYGGDGKINIKHSLDTGSAYENMALQGTKMGLVVHPMGGYNDELLRKDLKIPEAYQTELMVAIGKPGEIENLPESMRAKEVPSQRRVLSSTVFEGKAGVDKLLTDSQTKLT